MAQSVLLRNIKMAQSVTTDVRMEISIGGLCGPYWPPAPHYKCSTIDELRSVLYERLMTCELKFLLCRTSCFDTSWPVGFLQWLAAAPRLLQKTLNFVGSCGLQAAGVRGWLRNG